MLIYFLYLKYFIYILVFHYKYNLYNLITLCFSFVNKNFNKLLVTSNTHNIHMPIDFDLIF